MPFIKGQPAWNKGKHHSEQTKRKIADAMKGEKNPAKRPEVRVKIAKAKKGNRAWKDKKRSTKTKAKISNTLKGRKNTTKQIERWKQGHKGFKHSERTKELLRQKRVEQRDIMVDTSIELKVKKQLEKLEICFEHPFNLGNRFQCDFYLPSLNLILECDGDYWHNREDVKKKDKAKNAYAKVCGYNMLRMWEHDINSANFNILDILNHEVGGLHPVRCVVNTIGQRGLRQNV